MNIKPAQITLNALNDGHTMNELAQHIHDATAAVRAHGKPAEVKLTVKIAPVSGVAHGLVESPITMVAEVASKLPKDLPSTLFFGTNWCALTRSRNRRFRTWLTPSGRKPSLCCSAPPE